MNDLINNTVTSALDGLELKFKHDGNTFNLTITDDNADFPLRIIADDDCELLTIIGYFPVKIPKTGLEKMYELINSLNYRTRVGNFTIDPKDGELSFRLGNNVDGGAINEKIVDCCLMQVISRLHDNFDEIMKALFGGEHVTFTFAPSSEDQHRA